MPDSTPFEATNTPFDLSKYETPYERERTKILLDKLPSGDGRAIDIACGPGFYSRELSRRGWHVVGIDTDPQNLESAAQFAAETHLGDAVKVLGGFPSDSHDFALCMEIIEHMPKDHGTELVRQVFRVLKPGGRLLLSTPNRLSPEGLGGYYWQEKVRGERWQAWDATHVHVYSSLEIKGLLESLGFVIDGVTGYHYAGELPLLGRWKLPLVKSTGWPLRLLGFNTMLECRKP